MTRVFRTMTVAVLLALAVGLIAGVAAADPARLTLPAPIVEEATGPNGAAVTFSATAAHDGKALAVTCSRSSGSIFPLGKTTVECAASYKDKHDDDDDGGGGGWKTVRGSFTVTVRDTRGPVLTLPKPSPAEATAANGATVAYGSASASDAVDGAVAVTCTPASGTRFPLGDTVVSCTARDRAGNESAGSFTVVVRDTVAPTLESRPSLSVEAAAPSGTDVAWTTPAASDVVDGAVAATCAPASGSRFPLGTTRVTCTARDRAGNARSTSFDVTVADTRAPVLDALAPRAAEATGPAGAVVEFAPVAARDVVDGELPVSCAPASGSTFALGETVVTCTARDARGNEARGTFAVTVRDTTPPALALPEPLVAEATGPDGAVVPSAIATAVDSVDGAVAVVCDAPAGLLFPLGETAVRCAAADARGNSAAGTFRVVVVDTTAPAVTAPAELTLDPATQSAEAAGEALAAFLAAGSAADAVDGAVPVVTDAPASFGPGRTVVTFTAADRAGNVGTAVSAVTVLVVQATSSGSEGAPAAAPAAAQGPAPSLPVPSIPTTVTPPATAPPAARPVAQPAAPAKRSALLAPSAGQRVKKAPVLRWRRAANARYYNVQVYRGRTKLLSAWPAGTRLALRSSWTYGGKRHRLAPGVYSWFVFPGYGARAKGRYGPLLGSSTFVVVTR